jgi:HEAT repeat protein
MNKQLSETERHCRQRTEEARNDPRTTATLLRQALDAADDDDTNSDALTVLHFRATREVLDAVTPLCQSQDPRERSVAASVLGQLGVPERAYPEESHALLAAMLRRERDPGVLHDLGVACGHLLHPGAVPLLVELAGHAESQVRLGVVFGLLTREDGLSVATLIRLSADEQSESVRDWATFGLGQQIDLDTPAIRDALAARLTDADGPTRGEAMVGLATRGDERVLPALIAALAMDEDEFGERYDLVLQAADEFADPRLLPALRARHKRTPDDLTLESAIERCSRQGP